jgi:subtilisin family serine protease
MKFYITLFALLFTAGNALSQSAKTQENATSNLWYQKPFNKKKNFSIRLDKAYKLVEKLNPTEIVVAVIDGGTDPHHPDLQANMWHNPKEIPFNNLDDDNNGYTDDTVGWNFIGGKDGQMVGCDNLEIVRLVREQSREFEGFKVKGNPDKRMVERYGNYLKMKQDVEKNREKYTKMLELNRPILDTLQAILKNIGTENPTEAQVNAYEPKTMMESKIFGFLKQKGMTLTEFIKAIKDHVKQIEVRANCQYNIDYDPRSIVGDDYNNANEKFYGNNNVAGPDAFHGTHVAGIIAAVRGNGIGVEGVASKAKIMVVRVVPDGDERDKDVANGIRYAVDNGAKIINMSFGKGYSYNKQVVNEAVEYAAKKGVLLVHAAGNSNNDNDVIGNYPNDSLSGGRFAETWIEVGASQQKSKILPTDFSNYGKNNVDLFAPGYEIYSTTPNNGYENANGTSMASPVVAGVAALVWSCYPNLTAVQVKNVLMKSVTPYKGKVILPGTESDKVKFSDLSISGGVVNAEKALKMAAEIK